MQPPISLLYPFSPEGAHVHKQYHTHSCTEGCWAAPTMPPLPKCSCCSVAPVAVETADCITRRELRRESDHLSTLSSAYSSDSHRRFFFCPPQPPFVPVPPPFMSPSHHSFSSKTLKGRGEKKWTDLVFYIELSLSLTPQSTAILPWPSHRPQSKSKEAYLNTPFMNMSRGGSKRKNPLPFSRK